MREVTKRVAEGERMGAWVLALVARPAIACGVPWEFFGGRGLRISAFTFALPPLHTGSFLKAGATSVPPSPH